MAFVFYDTETTGTEASFDQILQFAAIRTDPDLNELERLEIRSRLLPHVVPAPGAMRVTGVTVAQLTDPALPSHYKMLCTIRDKLDAWSPAIFTGYNSIDYDEHLLRHAFYKTLHPPYLTNFNGNCRSDVLRMVQATSLFAPDALVLPQDGAKTVLKLDRVAPANGFNHEDAHDALGDVKATIFLCRLIMERAPEVWSSFIRFSQKAAVVDYISEERIFCLAEYFYGRPYCWLVTFMAANPDNSSEVYLYDLQVNPDDLRSLSDTDLATRLAKSPKPVRRMRCNASPILMPVESAPSNLACLELGSDELDRRAELIRSDDALRERLVAAFRSTRQDKEPSPYVEMQLYDGFFSNGDRALMDAFHKASWDKRFAIVEQFEDSRLKTLGKQLIHIERPDLLTEADRAEHDRTHIRKLLGSDGDVPWLTLPKAIQQIDDILAACEEAELALLREHREYLVSWLDRIAALEN